jgi:hypothetical protein
MRLKSIVTLLVLALLLAACGYPISTLPVAATETQTIPTPYPGPIISTIPVLPYPEPVMETPLPPSPAYPEPGTPETGIPVIPPSGYEPQPGDNNLRRDQVFLELASSKIISTTTDPSQVTAILQGNLPDPCHSLRVVVTQPDANNVIILDVYSVVDPAEVCITVLEPFTANIPLGSYSGDQYTVMANGEKLGEFGTAYGPQPGDAKLTRDKVFLELENSNLVVMESYPVQVSANLVGSLSDPCHQLRVVLKPADAKNQINLEVYSLFDPNMACITVIQPFSATIPLGSFSDGHYSVKVNGQLLGEFDA